MSFISKLINRVPLMFGGLGLLLLTGSYRGHEGGFQERPLIGIGLILLGVILWAVLATRSEE